jgi:uncharacterized membrane protein YfcA
MDVQALASHGSLSIAALALCAGFVGGIVRGYSGFGFALAAVPILSLGIVPAWAVPSVLIHELAIGLFTMRAVRANVSWDVFRVLAIGSMIGSPIGLALLKGIPADLMRLAVGAAVALSVAVIWRHPRVSLRLHPRLLFLAGIGSGVLNGGTAMSGPPAIIVLLGSDLAPGKVRGVLIHFIVFSAAIGVLLSLVGGMQSVETASVALWMAPGVLAGVPIGVLLYSVVPSAHYRRISLSFLLLVSAISLTASTRYYLAG